MVPNQNFKFGRIEEWVGGRGADLEKAASGARGHFVGNNAILRTFCSKYTVCFTEDEKGRVEDRELRIDKIDLS